MSEEERRRCCILGGCGCAPGGIEQLDAMAQLIGEARRGAADQGRDVDLAIAAAVLKLFGPGPHDRQLADLGGA